MSRSSSSQARIDRQTYMPSSVQQAMTQHMQQNLPQHLKKYVGQNAAYVPQHAQAQLAQAMQKNMPAHLKQYAGAYMQQNVVQPNTSRLHATPEPRAVAPHAPQPDLLRRDHAMFGEQHNVDPSGMTGGHQNMFQSDNNAPNQTPPPPAPPPAPLTGPPRADYDFIMNPPAPPKRSSLPGGNSLLGRVLVFGGGLVALLVVFSIVKGMLSGGSNIDQYLEVAQDQQAIIHLVTNAQQEKTLSGDNQNFAITAQLSLKSSQTDLVTYLGQNHKKVDLKQLNLKVTNKFDQQLQTAALASTYNQTFREILQTQLNEYISDLQQTYNHSKGPKGRALLSENYKQAQLLVSQLKSDSSAQN